MNTTFSRHFSMATAILGFVLLPLASAASAEDRRYDRHHRQYQYRYDAHSYGYNSHYRTYDSGHHGHHDTHRRFVIPRTIHHRDHGRYSSYYNGSSYYGDHHHNHRVYNFPVLLDGRYSYRRHAYCEGALFVEQRHHRHRGFLDFLAGVRGGGRVIVCADDHGASSLLSQVGERGYTYGTSAGAQLRAVDIRTGSDGTCFKVLEDGREAGEFLVTTPGLHNLRNALAAAAAARYFGAEWGQLRDGLASYAGVGRRFERLGAEYGVDIVDDYAHHPTEIESVLAATRELFPDRRLVAVFQPHLYSRTRDFAVEFGRALGAADVAFVTDVFPAREDPIPGVTGELVATAVDTSSGTEVHYYPAIDRLPEALSSFLKEGDVLLTLGAGSIEEVGPRTKVLLGGGRDA